MTDRDIDVNRVTFYKCLADDTRLRCLLLITQQQELCVCELTTALQESQPKISRHLSQLRKSGLLRDRRQGQWVFYSLNPQLPKWAQQTLQLAVEHQHDFLSVNYQRLQLMGERPLRTQSCC